MKKLLTLGLAAAGLAWAVTRGRETKADPWAASTDRL